MLHHLTLLHSLTQCINMNLGNFHHNICRARLIHFLILHETSRSSTFLAVMWIMWSRSESMVPPYQMVWNIQEQHISSCYVNYVISIRIYGPTLYVFFEYLEYQHTCYINIWCITCHVNYVIWKHNPAEVHFVAAISILSFRLDMSKHLFWLKHILASPYSYTLNGTMHKH
jgi:hypothetical protein